LGNKDTFTRDFDTHITTSNHNTISFSKDFIKVDNTLMVLNLTDDLDVLTLLTEDTTDILDILGTTDERGKDHINTILNTETEIVLVLLRKSREIDSSLGQVDTLLGAELTVILGLDADIVLTVFEDLEGKDTIIDVDVLTGFHDLGQVLVVNIHVFSITSIGVLVVGGEVHFVTLGDGDLDTILHVTSTDFRTLGIKSDSNDLVGTLYIE
jgi:hypothetical protein